MLAAPKLAILKTDALTGLDLTRLFPRSEFSLRPFDSLKALRELLQDEGTPFDGVVVVARPDMTHTESDFLRSIRFALDLNQLPVLLLGENLSGATRASALSLGADIVFDLNSSSEELFAVLSALQRRKHLIESQFTVAFESDGLRHSTMQALNLSREGLVIFNREKQLEYLNTAAGFLLALTHESSDDDIARTSAQLLPLLDRAIAEQTDSTSYVRRALLRADGQRFPAIIRIAPLEARGWCVGIADAAEWEAIEAKFASTDAARSLAFIAIAKLLEKSPSHPVENILSIPDESETTLDAFVTTLLETLDKLLPGSISIRIDQTPATHKEMKYSRIKLLRVIGSAALECADLIGAAGEISISFDKELPLRVRCTAISRRAASFLPYDHISGILNNLEEQRASVLDALVAGLPEVRVTRGWESGEFRIVIAFAPTIEAE